MLVSLAPLYYPDTLVNPDTCLGLFFSLLGKMNETFFGVNFKHCVYGCSTSFVNKTAFCTVIPCIINFMCVKLPFPSSTTSTTPHFKSACL